ncbi:Ankyrin-2 [Hondaea fermentalgiana]|uniref:Ankyrin-2 n=1 Tax=Hondaea fermentalgiana TaxID=2315210 RepID=A0A2R5GTT1_9STRA|nr:Ankyrin-2 [Hondaea fermentalgiana]|eukprot:GBG34276.1 Ankyrin-2 [Hondaea fermentalgiana]
MPKRRFPTQEFFTLTAKRAKNPDDHEDTAAEHATPDPIAPPHRLAVNLVEALRGSDAWQTRTLLGTSIETGKHLGQLEGLAEYLLDANLPETAWATFIALPHRTWTSIVATAIGTAMHHGEAAQARVIVDALGRHVQSLGLVRWPSRILRRALKLGHRDVVELLLDISGLKLDLNLGAGLAIRTAGLRGWSSVASKLLSCASVDPNLRPRFGSSALSNAARAGHLSVVTLMVQSSQVDVHLDEEDALCQAAMNGHTQIVEILLAHEAKPSCMRSFPFRMACRNGHLDAARLLAADPRTKVEEVDAEALNSAAYYGADDLVEKILATSACAELVMSGEPARIALERGHLKTARRILADSRMPETSSSLLLASASWSGLTEVVEELLRDADVDPSAEGQSAIRAASANGHAATVAVLLQANGVDPSVLQNEALRFASRGGHLDVVKLLLAHPRVDPTAEDSEALTAAAAGGRSEIVQILLQDGRADPTATNNLGIRMALENGHEDVALTLMRDARVNVAHAENQIFIMAADLNCVTVVRSLLAEETCNQVNPAARDNAAICLAAQKGYTEIVEALLADGRADPACAENDPIRYASRGGHVDVVRALLQDPRVDPCARDCEALIWAVEAGDETIMRLLVEESAGRVDPAAGNHAYLMWAIALNKADTVERLLKDPRVNPATNNDWPVREAARLGHADVVEVMARDPRVNVSAVKCVALRDACRLGLTDVVRVLLAQPCCDPSAINNASMRLACEYGRADVAKLLMADKRVRQMLKNQSIMIAKEHNHADVMCVLIESGHFKLRMIWVQLMRWACERNHVGVAKALLRDRDARPDFDSDWALRTCCELGHADIVEALLEDGRAHPSVHNYSCFRAAVHQGCARVVRALLQANAAPSGAQQGPHDASPLVVTLQMGHLDVFRLLLEHPQFVVGPNLIVTAVTCGRTEMVDLLLQDERVDPTVQSSRVLQVAASGNRVDIVSLLLKDGRVDVEASDCLAFREAALRGHDGVVTMLLAESKVDPRVMNHFALRQAAGRGHDKVVRILLEDGRSDPAIHGCDAILSAARHHRMRTVRVLLSSPRLQRRLSGRLLQNATIRKIQASMESDALQAAQVSCMVYRALIGRPPQRRGLSHHKDLIIEILLFASADKLILAFDKEASIPRRARRLIEDLIRLGEDRDAKSTAGDALVALAARS